MACKYIVYTSDILKSYDPHSKKVSVRFFNIEKMFNVDNEIYSEEIITVLFAKNVVKYQRFFINNHVRNTFVR